MLTHLQMRDLVIVDHAELELAAGLTALTGETGAGKSIIVDALLLISGGRAGGDVVRQDAERAEVTATFAPLPAAVHSWLNAHSIDHEGEIIVRRVVGADGRSRAYVNGQVVPLQELRELAAFFIEIHGQQEFQRLVNRAAQRDMLDEHVRDSALLRAVFDAYHSWHTCRREVEDLKTAAMHRDSRLDLLRYQLTELKAEVTTTAAIDELFVDQKRIAGRGRLGLAAGTALLATYDAEGENAHDLLGRAQAALRNVLDADPQLAPVAQLLAEAMINIQEAADTLRRFLDALDIDPARQEDIERHAAALESLARKHRINVMELPAQLARTEQDLGALQQVQHKLTERELQLAALTETYRTVAQRLTQARKVAGEHLSGEITRLMQALGMAGGRFAVNIAPSDAEFSPTGSDDVDFLVSANPGQATKALAKVASGGELSRISLSIQVAAAAAKTSALCMVFDEVDAGIGGAVAEIVGRQLRALGERAQVLCVTHLAQVASQAHGQFRVNKSSDGKMTRTVVSAVSPAERIDEIARMLGGIDITEQARAHAREMLALAASPEHAVKKKRTPEARQ